MTSIIDVNSIREKKTYIHANKCNDALMQIPYQQKLEKKKLILNVWCFNALQFQVKSSFSKRKGNNTKLVNNLYRAVEI